MLFIQEPQAAAVAQGPNYVPPESVDAWGQLTTLASDFGQVDGLFYFTLVVCIFFFLLITGILGYSVVKYRRKTIDQPAASNTTHHTTLEVVWTVIPLIIVMVIFAWGWKGSLDMTVVPADARQYKAMAKQWSWTFFYPNDNVNSINELWVEVGQPAVFTIESSDVLHAFFIPAMRVKRDVVPGRLGTVWFLPTQIGKYHLFCAEYCGKDHSQMYARVNVVSAGEYAKRPWDNWDPLDLVGGGEKIYLNLCKSCHTIDGTDSVGPTWKGLYGKQRTVLVGGPNGPREEITVDDDYIMESVRKPSAKIAAEKAGAVMTPYDEAMLPDDRLFGVIEFIKSLAGNPGGNK